MKKLFTLIIVIGFYSLSFSQVTSIETRNYKGDNYSLNYPSSWSLLSNENMNGGFFIFSKMEGNKDIFRENVNLIIEKAEKGNSVEDYVNISKKNIKSGMKQSKIIESRTEGNSHVLVYSGEMGFNKLKWMQKYFLKNGNIYILTFTAESQNFDKYLEEANIIFNSFTL